MAECSRCNGVGWVCEAHPDRPWEESERGCDCSPGVPCPVCNPSDRNTPPRWPTGSRELDDDEIDDLISQPPGGDNG